jgi:hypothetical protein
MYWWSSGERLRRSEIVPEGFLDYHPAVLGEPGAGESLDHGPEQNGGIPGRTPAAVHSDAADAIVGGVVAEAAADVAELPAGREKILRPAVRQS